MMKMIFGGEKSPRADRVTFAHEDFRLQLSVKTDQAVLEAASEPLEQRWWRKEMELHMHLSSHLVC